MDTATRLREQPIIKTFFRYLIPSALGLLLMSINIVIDGIFIGHGVGADGLAGVNIAVPIYSLFYAISLWVGIGGGTLFSIYIGQDESKKANEIFTLSFLIVTVSTIVISILSLLVIERLAYLFGANDQILPYVLDYMFVILLFGIVFVLESVLSIFIRNDGNPILAMVGLSVAAVLNIILNYVFIFIFGWGVKGAAYATVLATFIAFIVMLAHFFYRKSTLSFVRFTFNFPTLKRIITIGFPSLVSEVSVAFLIFGYNITLIRMAGETGVAAFSVINYLHTMVALMFFGVGSAIQPIVSFFYGAKLEEKMNDSLRLAIRTAIIIGIFSFVASFLFAGPLAKLFNVTEQPLYDMTVQAMRIFFINYLFLGFNLVYAIYFQSIGAVKFALMITVARRMVLILIFLLVLPPLFGIAGVWLVVPLAEILTLFLILYIRKQNDPLHSPNV